MSGAVYLERVGGYGVTYDSAFVAVAGALADLLYAVDVYAGVFAVGLERGCESLAYGCAYVELEL